jgi:hypothetical protein
MDSLIDDVTVPGLRGSPPPVMLYTSKGKGKGKAKEQDPDMPVSVFPFRLSGSSQSLIHSFRVLQIVDAF